MDFDLIYQTYFEDVFLYLRGLSNSETIAEEITQETFMKALKALDRFDGSKDIKAWLLPHQKTENWYYSDSKPSHTWGGAPNFFNHWKDRVGVRSSTNDAKKGDPFSVDYGGDNIPEHTLIITSVSGTSTSNMKYACHTSDQFEEPGKSLRTIYDSCESVWIYKVG